MNVRVASLLAIFTLAVSSHTSPAADNSFVPSNPPAMKPLHNHASPAYIAASHFMRGVNLGNYLEMQPGPNRVTLTTNDFAEIAGQGFDHVRVPIGWHRSSGPGPEFQIPAETFAEADFVITNCLARQLAVLINIHHFEAFTTNPREQEEKFLAIWRQIAAHYSAYPDSLAFELLNEPHGEATTAVMNSIYERALKEIRSTNPRRTVFVEPGNWGGIDELKHLVLGADDNVIVSVHCYDPFYFTHQGASWAGPDVTMTGIRFPGPPPKPLEVLPSLNLTQRASDWIHRYNTLPAAENPCSPKAFEGKLAMARAWSDYYGRPVHVGEFGCFTTADPESRARFYGAFRHAVDRLNLGWAIWDWNAGFRYWDRDHQRPMPGMREALFGK